MSKNSRYAALVCWIACLGSLTQTPSGWAQDQLPPQDAKALTAEDATMSVKVAAVNGKPLPGGPAGTLTVHPGDVLSVEILVRNWSRHGDTLRAFQATMDEHGFTTGLSGTIEPLAYDETTGKGLDNKANCFVDTARPDYAFKGLQNFGVTDSVSPGYRWMGAVLEPNDSPKHAQNGREFYCGSVNMKVSDDARGTFTVGLIEEEWGSTLRTPMNFQVLGLTFERMVVNVEPDALRVVSAEPPAGAIDARWLGRSKGADRGWDRVTLTFNQEPRGLTTADFEIVDGTNAPPRIKDLQFAGPVATLSLDRGTLARRWTTVTHKSSGTGTKFALLPGDVDASGVVDTDDFLRLVEPQNAERPLAVFQCDIDGDGACGPKDALREIELLGQPEAPHAKLGLDPNR